MTLLGRNWILFGSVIEIDSDFVVCVEPAENARLVVLSTHHHSFLSVLLTPLKDPVLHWARKKKDSSEHPTSASQAAVCSCGCCFFLCHLALLT